MELLRTANNFQIFVTKGGADMQTSEAFRHYSMVIFENVIAPVPRGCSVPGFLSDHVVFDDADL